MNNPITLMTLEELQADPCQATFESQLQPLSTPRRFHTSIQAHDVKEIFKEFFSAHEGYVHW